MSEDINKISDASGGDAPQEKRTLDTKNIELRRRTAPHSSTEHNISRQNLIPKDNTIIVQNPDGESAIGIEHTLPRQDLISKDNIIIEQSKGDITPTVNPSLEASEEDAYTDSPAHRRDMRKERIAARRRNRTENSPYLLQNVIKRTEEFDTVSSKMTTQERIAHLKKLKEAQQLPQIASYSGKVVTSTPQNVETPTLQDPSHKALLDTFATSSQVAPKETALQRLRRVLQDKKEKQQEIETTVEIGNIPTKELQKRYERKKRLHDMLKEHFTKIGAEYKEKEYERLLQTLLNFINDLEDISPKFAKYVKALKERSTLEIRSGKEGLKDDDKITVQNSSAQNVGRVFDFGRKKTGHSAEVPNFFYKGYSPIEFKKDIETETEKLMQELLSFKVPSSLMAKIDKKLSSKSHVPSASSSEKVKNNLLKELTLHPAEKMKTLKTNALKLIRRIKSGSDSADPVRTQQMATKNVLDTTRRTPENPAVL